MCVRESARCMRGCLSVCLSACVCVARCMRLRCLCVWVYALRTCMDVYSFWKLNRFCRFCRWCMCTCVCVCVCVSMAVAHPARANIFCHKFEKALPSLAAHLDIHSKAHRHRHRYTHRHRHRHRHRQNGHRQTGIDIHTYVSQKETKNHFTVMIQ